MSNFIYVLKDLFSSPGFTAVMTVIATGLLTLFFEKIKEKHNDKIFITDKLIQSILTSYAGLSKRLFKFQTLFKELRNLTEEERQIKFLEEIISFTIFVWKKSVFIDKKINKTLDSLIDLLNHYCDNKYLSDEYLDELETLYSRSMDCILALIKLYSGAKFAHDFLRKNLNIKYKLR